MNLEEALEYITELSACNDVLVSPEIYSGVKDELSNGKLLGYSVWECEDVRGIVFFTPSGHVFSGLDVDFKAIEMYIDVMGKITDNNLARVDRMFDIEDVSKGGNAPVVSVYNLFSIDDGGEEKASIKKNV